MKKMYLFLSVAFIMITLIGSGYVLISGGQKNAGYAVIPMVFAVAFLTLYRSKKNTPPK